MAQRLLSISAGGVTTEVDSTAMPLAGGTFTGAVVFPGTGTWTATGSVGIGKAVPSTKVHIYEAGVGTGLTIEGSGNAGSALTFAAGGEVDSKIAGFYDAGTAKRVLTFWVGGTTPTEKMRITDGGLVGINSTNPSYELHVVGKIYSTGNVGFNGTAPIAKPALNAACTDLATCVALTNQIRAALIAYGLCS